VIKEHTGANTMSLYSYAVFMASGFVVFNIFKQILSKSIGAFDANKALFSYKQVKPIDTILARVLVEFFLISCVIVVFFMIGFLFDIENFVPKNILMVFITIIWFVIFSLGIGLLVGIGNFFYMSIGKFVNIISFLLLIFSGVFFSLSSVPPIVRDLLLYNPLTHFMEMLHGFYLYGLDDRYVNYSYILYWTMIPYLVSLWLYLKLEKRIISQ
jgi:capsular polysaccharide transport system permease protein